jgi:hypothetical protein
VCLQAESSMGFPSTLIHYQRFADTLALARHHMHNLLVHVHDTSSTATLAP